MYVKYFRYFSKVYYIYTLIIKQKKNKILILKLLSNLINYGKK